MLYGRRWSQVVVFALLVAGMVQAVEAQVGRGALAGRIVDPAGSAVPGATVTVVEAGTNRSRTVVTGADGNYAVQGLAPGTYRVRVELSGFRTVTRNGIRLATGETIRLDLQLDVGGVTEAITVTGDAPLLRSETSGLGQVVDNRKVVDLPLNGRSFITLASLAPGVALPPGSSLPHINGGRPRTNEYLFDGISVRTRRRLVHRTPSWEPPLLERSPMRAIPGSFNSR
jgi:Carboxypeptidase regulatory-like domain